MLVADSSHISPPALKEVLRPFENPMENALAATNVGLQLSLENQSTSMELMHASATREVLLFGASSFTRGLKTASGGRRSKTSLQDIHSGLFLVLSDLGRKRLRLDPMVSLKMQMKTGRWGKPSRLNRRWWKRR
jgi:hypothetical protein